MAFKITAPVTLHASIGLPSSKSISNRVLIINALADGRYVPQNLSDCDDTRVMIKALTSSDEVVDIMAAGTAMRFLTAYLSVTDGSRRMITGTKRMQQRPIHVLVDALRRLGAKIDYAGEQGFPPLRIDGTNLKGGELSIAGNVSSQYISALLMVAPYLEKGLALKLEGEIVSEPYINLTLQLMRGFGAKAAWTADDRIDVQPVPYTSVPFTVESDWSAASYWYQMTALSREAEVELPGLLENSYQGDSKVKDLFRLLGVETRFTDNGIVLTKSFPQVTRLEYDFVNQPDLAQTFVVTCALLGIPFRFNGLQSLKIKETDRIAALINEMAKLGYTVKEQDGSVLYWDGEYAAPAEVPVIDTYEDHRMALAFAPASLVIPEIVINNPQVVSKSYPGYWNDLEKAGFAIREC